MLESRPGRPRGSRTRRNGDELRASSNFQNEMCGNSPLDFTNKGLIERKNQNALRPDIAFINQILK